MYNRFSISLRVLTGPCIHPGRRGSLPGVNRPQPEVYRTPLSSAEVKNEWLYTYNSLVRLRELCRDNDMSAVEDTSLSNPKGYRIKEDDRDYLKLRSNF
jgi:hypothetical protein